MNHSLTLRPYQSELLQQAISRNVIINLPTGSGKTLIAVHLLDHTLDLNPNLKVLFIVPTKALATQQTNYIKVNTRHNRHKVGEFAGSKYENWSEKEWTAAMKNLSVLVGTPEIFRKALYANFIYPQQFSLVILDECHHCKKNHPMVFVLNRFWVSRKSSTSKHLKLYKFKFPIQSKIGRSFVRCQNLWINSFFC
jgi:endoribonuclease Dicer